MVRRWSVLVATIPMVSGCGSAEVQPKLLVRISADSQCSLEQRPANCDAVGTWIVKEYASTDYEVQICAHKRARYERVAAALESIRAAGFRRVRFLEIDPADGGLCTGNSPAQ
jgi:biopolymer transport protein ExbD